MPNFKHFNFFNPRYWYIYAFFLGLIVRIFTIVHIPPEFWEYESIATNILSGKGFTFYHMQIHYKSYCEPFYPFFSAVIYFLTHHNVFILELMQAFFSCLISVVIYFLSLDLFGRRVAFLSAILVALHPGLIIYTIKLHPLTFDALFISLSLFAMLKLAKSLNYRNTIIAGLMGGLCVLTRPTILVFLPLALAYILKTRKTGFMKSMSYAFIFFIFSGMVFLPWTLRNYIIQRQFILTRSNTPYVFWLGNNPHFSGSALTKEGGGILDLAPPGFKANIEKLDEAGQNKEFLNASLKYIKQYPLGFMERTLKKFYYFWWFTPQTGLLYPDMWFILYKTVYFFIFMFALLGLYFTYKEGMFNHRIETVLIVFVMLSVSMIQSLFYIETRHRWAIEPVLLIFSSKGFIHIFYSIKIALFDNYFTRKRI